MTTVTGNRTARRCTSLAIGALVTLALAGCGGSEESPAAEADPSGSGASEGADSFDQAVHDMLPESVRSSGTVTIGITPEDPPFMVKADGGYEGIIPDLMDEVSEVMGVEFELAELPFPGLIPAVQSNKISYISTSMFDTAEREQVIDMVSYQAANFGLLVQKGNPKDINFLEDLCGTVASTTNGTVMAVTLEEQKAKCAEAGDEELTINLYDNQSAAQVQLQSGKVDSFLGTYTPMRYLSANAGGGNTFEMAEGTYPAGYLAVGASKAEPGLAQAMQAALAQVVEDGAYEEILAEHDAASDVLSADLILLNGRTSGELE